MVSRQTECCKGKPRAQRDGVTGTFFPVGLVVLLPAFVRGVNIDAMILQKGKFMIRFVLIVNLIIILSAVVVANDKSKALALLKGVEKERLKYDCFHIRYEEHREETYQSSEQIVDFDKEKIRKEYLPGKSFAGMKSILLEDVIYCMGSYDEKHVAIVPHQSTNAYGAGIYDPRMLGLTDMMNHNTSVGESLLYKSRSNFSISREDLNGRSVYVVECRDGERNGFAHWKLYIEEPGFFLIRKTVDAEWGKIQIDNDYSEQKFLPFPTKVHIYRVAPQKDESGREIVDFDRYITIKDVQIKKSFPPETFTLAGLNPPLNSDVVDYRISRRLGYWDGEKLVDDPVSVSAQELRELTKPARKGGLLLFVGIGIGILLILWGLYLFARKNGWIK